jgi:hypothetical protein
MVKQTVISLAKNRQHNKNVFIYMYMKINLFCVDGFWVIIYTFVTHNRLHIMKINSNILLSTKKCVLLVTRNSSRYIVHIF